MDDATHFNATFKQHGHGNLRMQARVVPTVCGKHAGRFVTAAFTWRGGNKRPAYIKLTEVIGEPAAGKMPRRCGDTLEEHYWFSQHGNGNLRMQARAVPSCITRCSPIWVVSRPLIKANVVSGPLRHRTLSHGKSESSKPADQRCNSVPCNGLYGARG